MHKISFFFALGTSFFFTAQAHALTFSRACERGDTLTIAAAGDVLLHGPLQIQAYRSRDTAGSLWENLAPLIQEADLAYANLEGPVAMGVAAGGRLVKDPGMVFDKNVYSGYPLFNYHPILAWDLKKAGFDIVSTANNHAMDRGPIGVDKTIGTLDSANLAFVGSRTQAQAARGEQPWSTITKKNGWTIAWIACSFSTNGNPDPKGQILGCFKDADKIEQRIRSLRDSVDAVIITPHWGEVEYSTRIEPSQRALAKRFVEAGATAILGNHPHVTKPWEKITTSDGRETLVIYSIGNFVSNQQALAKRTSAIFYVGLTKASGKRAWVNGATFVPTYMRSSPYEVSADQVPAEAVRLLDGMLGADRRQNARARIETNPECN